MRPSIAAGALFLAACQAIVPVPSETSTADSSSTTDVVDVTGVGLSSANTTDSATSVPATSDATGGESTEPTTTVTSETDPGETTAEDPDTGLAPGFCVATCNEALDCCAANPHCENVGTYPYDYTCEANGTCSSGGCIDDDQCSLGGVLAGWICVESDGVAFCAPGCDYDLGCQGTLGYETYHCTGANGFCEAPPCATDDDCWLGVCYPDEGFCGCGSDQECPNGFVCAR